MRRALCCAVVRAAVAMAAQDSPLVHVRDGAPGERKRQRRPLVIFSIAVALIVVGIVLQNLLFPENRG